MSDFKHPRTDASDIDAFCAALKDHVGEGSPLRLGQLIYNLTARRDGTPPSDYHFRLYGMETLDLIALCQKDMP
jgi:hypothetical protein